MLVLTRKALESIVINNEIKVTVLEIRGDRARIGIEAKKEIGVHRYEVWEKIQSQGEQQSCTNQEKPLNGSESEPLLSGIVKIDQVTA